MSDEKIHGFAPIVGEAPRVLILGSMPSIASLGKQQYYGHPRNAFWPILMRLLLPADSLVPEDYEERVRLAKVRGIAIWDVIASCERETSSDARIRSERPNEFARFLEEHPTLVAIFFNGRKAEESFRRHVQQGLAAAAPELRMTRLPSTSPALAALGFEEKLEAWRELLSVLENAL